MCVGSWSIYFCVVICFEWFRSEHLCMYVVRCFFWFIFHLCRLQCGVCIPHACVCIICCIECMHKETMLSMLFSVCSYVYVDNMSLNFLFILLLHIQPHRWIKTLFFKKEIKKKRNCITYNRIFCRSALHFFVFFIYVWTHLYSSNSSERCFIYIFLLFFRFKRKKI